MHKLLTVYPTPKAILPNLATSLVDGVLMVNHSVRDFPDEFHECEASARLANIIDYYGAFVNMAVLREVSPQIF